MLQSTLFSLTGLLCLSIFSIADSLPGKWVKINPSLTPQSLETIFFVSPAVGWAGGRNGTIVHTEDSGNTWVIQQTPRNCLIRSIFFHDQNEGWAVGEHGILYTTNGGKQWSQRNIVNDSLVGGYKIVFQNRNKGWGFFSSSQIPIQFAKTEDGGKSWVDCSGLVENPRLNDIVFVNDSLGFICADRYLAKTRDGGKTWVALDTSGIAAVFPFLKLQMLDTSIGYCMGPFSLAKTIDGGKTWNIVLLERSGGDFVDLHFSCADTGFVFEEEYDYMHLFRTNDGGRTWSNKVLNNLHVPITSVSFPERNKGIGAGYNGAIYRILGESDSVFEITKGTGYELMCMDFCDARHGYAGTGHIWRRDSALLFTTDGGSTWNKRQTPLKTIDKLICFDSNTIAIYGGMDTLVRQHFFRSIDGGQTWSGIGDFGYIYSLEKIRNSPYSAYFFTSNTYELVITRDAGKTLIKKNLSMDDFDSTTRIMGISFLNADTAWLLCSMSIYFTSDGCSTWKKIPFSGANYLSRPDIYFSSYKVGWIVGYMEDFRLHTHTGSIFRTDDAGITWREQSNITYFPDYYTPDVARQSIFKIYADDDGKRAWALGEEIGILHTFDGGEHWTPDTIPGSPGMGFTDLAFNKSSNTLWVTSDYFGIWKYEIPSDNAIKNTPIAFNEKSTKRIISANNGIIVPLRYSSDKISVEIFDISGRLVFSKFFANDWKSNSFFLPLSFLPTGHYIGNIHYSSVEKRINASSFKVNIIK